MKKNISLRCLSAGFLLLASLGSAHALEVNITKTISYVDTMHNGKPVRIQRVQDQTHSLDGAYTKTSRKCPPFCVQPMLAERGVNTVGELEVLEFIREKVNRGTGVLVDARTPSWHEKGTIPSAINIPFSTFADSTSDAVKGTALERLGVRMKSSDSDASIMDFFSQLIFDDDEIKQNLDFDNAKEVMVWCNGIWCGQSHAAISGLVRIGYPVDKIHYYRGGMQAWLSLGLTVVK